MVHKNKKNSSKIQIVKFFHNKNVENEGIQQWLKTNLGVIPMFDNSKIMKEIAFEFTPIEKTLEDLVIFFLKKEVLPLKKKPKSKL